MQKILNGVLTALFFFGVVIYSSVHEAHYGLSFLTTGTSHVQHSGGCDGEAPAGHDSDNCPICQLAVTPLIVASAVPVPILTIPVGEIIFLPADTPSVRLFYTPHFARGPPKA